MAVRFIPVKMRLPLKFGAETIESIQIAHIGRDGLKCLKNKLAGRDAEGWDHDRMVRVGKTALRYGGEALSPDFDCLVREPAYVNDILVRLKAEEPAVYDPSWAVRTPERRVDLSMTKGPGFRY